MAAEIDHDPLCPSDITCGCGMVHRSYTCQCDIIRTVRADYELRLSTGARTDRTHDVLCPGHLPGRVAHAAFTCSSCDLLTTARAALGAA